MRAELSMIVKRLRRERRGLAVEFKVKSLGVFGSFVQGRQRARSDVDILVDFSEPPSLFRFMELEQRLGDALKRKVDLVDEKHLPEF